MLRGYLDHTLPFLSWSDAHNRNLQRYDQTEEFADSYNNRNLYHHTPTAALDILRCRMKIYLECMRRQRRAFSVSRALLFHVLVNPDSFYTFSCETKDDWYPVS